MGLKTGTAVYFPIELNRTGLTDVEYEIVKCLIDGTLSSFKAATTAAEITTGTFEGAYLATFTPDVAAYYFWVARSASTGLFTGGVIPVEVGEEKDIEDKVDTIDGIVDNILIDTGTTLPGVLEDIKQKATDPAWSQDTDSLEALREAIDVIDGIVDDILEDTGTTLDNLVDDLESRLSSDRAGYLDELDFDLDARLGSPAGASLAADLLTIDNFVDELESRLTSTRAGYIDNLSAGAAALEATLTAIKGDGWSAETLKAIYDLVDALMDASETGGTLSANGSEQTVYEQASPSAIWNPCVVYIDLTNMAASDAITVKEYVKIKSGGSYLLLDAKDYENAQTRKAINISPVGRTNRYGYKVTLEQTAGTNRDFDWEVIYEA